MSNAECPECGAQIAQRAGIEVGEIISCGDCGSKLEVKSVAPFGLATAPSVEEDWGE
ncbi:lysine biosynthesis protein LysW [Candidatus Micrarchaeota archaeon]|nr:lysine biosynthesis protein LysW [Candidatus Micrarchaeota archaeon]